MTEEKATPMKITKMKMNIGVTLSMPKYESIRIDVGAECDVDEDMKPSAAHARLRAALLKLVKADVAEAKKDLKPLFKG